MAPIRRGIDTMPQFSGVRTRYAPMPWLFENVPSFTINFVLVQRNILAMLVNRLSHPSIIRASKKVIIHEDRLDNERSFVLATTTKHKYYRDPPGQPESRESA